jgi:hypothetical protein
MRVVESLAVQIVRILQKELVAGVARVYLEVALVRPWEVARPKVQVVVLSLFDLLAGLDKGAFL